MKVNNLFSKEKWENYFSKLELKDYLTLFFMIVSIIIMLFVYLFPIESTEIIRDNPTINLHNTLIHPEILYELEKNQEREYAQKDELKNIELNKNNNVLTLKFLETDDSKRFIIVLLADPNNMIRFSSVKFNENMTNDFDINEFPMHKITNEKNIKIKIPYSNNYIYGNWHLNVYIYNNQKELTAVVSKPIDYK